MALSTDSSPFQSSPLEGAASPRLFWQSKNNENSFERSSPSPTRRSSIERLQKASRVKNSNILALEQKHEYDPTKLPQVERPLSKVQGNAFGGTGISGYRDNSAFSRPRSESAPKISLHSLNKSLPPLAKSPLLTRSSPPNGPRPASRDQASPTKSSLTTSRFRSSHEKEIGYDSEDDYYDDEHGLPSGRILQRHAKSVTFDAAPPQVNEYEMVTPDVSSIATSSREGSYDSEEDSEDENHYLVGIDGHDDSFDASLEDTVKTPVVLPEDWRQDFNGSPLPDTLPSFAPGATPQQDRSDSRNSNGDHRPLPPLPGLNSDRRNSNSSAGLSATAERMLGSQRTLPSPPPASPLTKAEVQNIGNGKMTLEERLRLMMLSDDSNSKSAAEQQRERRMRRAGARDRADSQTLDLDLHDMSNIGDEDDTLGDLSGLGDYQLPPQISRESILKRADGYGAVEGGSELNFSSPAPSSPERNLPLDPDVPIPSTEDSELDDDVSSMPSDDDYLESDSIIDQYQHSESGVEGTLPHNDVDRNEETDVNYDSESNYDGPGQAPTPQEEKTDPHVEAKREEKEFTTPRTISPNPNESSVDTVVERDLPELPSTQKHNPFTDDLQAFMLPKPIEIEEPESSESPESQQRPVTPDYLSSKPVYDGSGWGEPDEYDDEEPRTPDSVIHRPLFPDPEEEEEEAGESPVVPDETATIKSASGSKLKTRPSATPADIEAMRTQRRIVSREVPDLAAVPDRHQKRLSQNLGGSEQYLSAHSSDDYMMRHPSFKSRSLTLDLDIGLSLDQDFDRVIEAQKVVIHQFPDYSNNTYDRFLQRQASGVKLINSSSSGTVYANMTPCKQRGYLMRQNTKVVTASDKDLEDLRPSTRSAGNSPVKTTRPQSWTVEPWNGQVRKKSIRKRPVNNGPVPPMPGQESNATPMLTVTEEEPATETNEESGERGRLFVKVMGVKDLDLPIPKSKCPESLDTTARDLTSIDERTWFSLTLDNGVHCVTTAWLELARNAPIGQEFELVVPNDLEFQLTLNVKLEKPPPQKIVHSQTSPRKTKTSTLSRVFASPKKRKEMELRQKEEEERLARQQREAHARQIAANPTAWDLLSPLAAEDGSFARAYVCLKEHETRCFGRPYLVDVACFNEWATEEAGFASSVKSKRGSTSIVRKAPYKIGKLELQLLFVPRPKGSTDDDMPKSMNSCIREMKAAEERRSRNWEGHLSQQGGDCPVSRSFLDHFRDLLLTNSTVLASPLLQACRHKVDCLSRGYAAAACHHQPRKCKATHR